MRRSLVLLALLAWAAPARPADPVVAPPDLAARAWAITDAVLTRHVDPPSRQQMILAGLRALDRAGKVASPPGLALRVSALQEPGPLAAILAESWPGLVKTDRVEGLVDAFLEGLLSVVPGGAQLLSSKQWKVEEQVEANLYVGIQVALGTTDGYPSFQQVLPGGPAERSGAKAGDVIEAVDGVSTRDMPLAEVVDRIRGEEGTEVLIRLRKADRSAVADVPMTRGRLPRKTILGLGPRPEDLGDVRLDGPAPIGYLKVTEIVGSTPQELRTFAAQMEGEGLRALVLDFRQVHQAGFHPTVLLADALLDGGVIGRVVEADSTREIRAEPDALFRGWPMVVLAVAGQSPEVDWLCAGLEDNHRATILHQSANRPRQAGPMVVSVVPLPGGEWFVRLATGRLERGDGRPLPGLDPKALLGRMGVGGPVSPDALDPYAEPVPSFRIAPRVGARPPANGPPDRPLGFFNPAVIAPEDPLPRARALLEAALKAPGS